MNKTHIIILSISLNLIMLIIIICLVLFSNKQDSQSSLNHDYVELKPRVTSNLQANTDEYLNTLHELQERIKNCDPGDLEEIKAIVKDFGNAQYKLNKDASASMKPDYPVIAKQLDEATNTIKKTQEESANK